MFKDRDQQAGSRDAKDMEHKVREMADRLFPPLKQPSWPRENAEEALRKWRFE